MHDSVHCAGGSWPLTDDWGPGGAASCTNGLPLSCPQRRAVRMAAADQSLLHMSADGSSHLPERGPRVERAVAERVERELKECLDHAAEGLHWVGPDGTILWA